MARRTSDEMTPNGTRRRAPILHFVDGVKHVQSAVVVCHHECYDSDSAVNNRNSGCSANGAPMWNIGASSHAHDDVLALCRNHGSGQWIGIYAPTVGLNGKEMAIVDAINTCTTE